MSKTRAHQSKVKHTENIQKQNSTHCQKTGKSISQSTERLADYFALQFHLNRPSSSWNERLNELLSHQMLKI